MLYRDLYAIVGAQPDWTVEQIQEASRRHPFMSDPSSRAAQRIQSACELLTDPVTREAYDRIRTVMDHSELDRAELGVLDLIDIERARHLYPGMLIEMVANPSLGHETVQAFWNGTMVLRCSPVIAHQDGWVRWQLWVDEARSAKG